MRSGLWRADGFLGLAVAVLFALLGRMSDLAVQSASRTPADPVAIIAIDKQSIDNIGRSPWPRDTHAKMIDLLAQAKARAVGCLVFFSEPLFRIANEPPADIRSFAGIPEGLVRFIERALAKNPDERYRTGEHFGGELRLALGTAAKVDLEI